MLKKILSKDTCANCRICCVFDNDDLWELPGEIEKPQQSEDGLYYCPKLSEKGCTLGDKKPFECKIWPFRVMEYKGNLVITLSPVCDSLYKKPLNELMEFLKNDRLYELIFKTAKQLPDIVKPYVNGYPILWID